VLPNNNNIITVFFKENVTYLVWICRDLISLILGTWFSLIQGTRWQFSLILETRFSILGTRIRSLKHIKKTLIILLVYCRLVVHTDTIIDTRAWKVVSHPVAQFAHDHGKEQNTLSSLCCHSQEHKKWLVTQ